MVTDVGMAGTADTAWAPLTSARLVGQWPRAGIETIVLRGAAAPRTAGHGVSCRHGTARPRRHRCSRCRASLLPRSRARRALRPTQWRMNDARDRCVSPTTGSGAGKWPRFSSARRRLRGSRTSPRSNGGSDAGPAMTVRYVRRRVVGLGAGREPTQARLASRSTFRSLAPDPRAAWTCAPRSRRDPSHRRTPA